jgi:hypothetical protein
MITYTLNLTPAAVEDIKEGLDYYNTLATDLGFRFAAEVDNSLQAIAKNACSLWLPL